MSPRRKVERVDTTASGADCRDFERPHLGRGAHLGLRHEEIGEPDAP
jgi:hypothetical protein